MVSGQEAVRALSAASVTIVIPVWNRADLLRALLRTIAAQTAQPECVLIVDNASTEDIGAVADEAGTQFIRMESNLGFAAAVNRGIATVTTEWIALINSDVELAPDWLSHLMQRANETDGWFACGKLLSAADPTLIDGTWDLIACSGCAYRAGSGRSDEASFSQERTIDLCPATATIYRRELFDRVGGFAEVYGSYLEDVDFSVRCAVAGYRGVYVPSARATHMGQGSTGRWSARVVELVARNQAMLVKRLYPEAVQRRFRRKIIAGQLLWGLVACRHGRLRAWLRGRREARKLDVPREALVETELERVLAGSEREIRSIQRVKPDLYWRLYFLIAGESE